MALRVRPTDTINTDATRYQDHVLQGPIETLYAVLVAAKRDLNAMTGAPGLSLEAKNRYGAQALMVARAMEDVPEAVRRAFHAGTMTTAPVAEKLAEPVAEKLAEPAPEETDDEDLF